MTRSLGVAIALAAATALAAGAAAGALAVDGPTARAAAAKKITPAGVGQVKLGMTFAQLRAKHLVGKLRNGCELSGPNTKTSRLRSPLRGNVDWTKTTPRRAKRITVSRGAKARGVGIGDRLADIKAAFPKAKVNHSTEDMFGITLVRIPKDGGGKIAFSVRVDTKKIDLIGVPVIPFCE
jgi:hypothetical protein